MPWYNPEIKELSQEKRKSYLKYITKLSSERRREYIEVRNRVNARVRMIKEGHWESFTADMEHDIYGAQKMIWKLLKNSKREISESFPINEISIQEWDKFFCDLYQDSTYDTVESTIELMDDITLSIEEVEKELKSLKNRKSPGPDGISNEMLK